MIVIRPSYEILTKFTGDELKNLELIGRTCYKSTDKIEEGSAERFIRGLINRRHDAMLEHMEISVKFICDRGISHEIVRHRMASFAQESTRYCNYASGKFGHALTFIRPYFFDDENYLKWVKIMEEVEKTYFSMIESGVKPEEARTILPNSIKTELIMTANLREWRHFFKLRALGVTGKPHPQMTEITVPLLKELNDKLPIIFEDLVLDLKIRKEKEKETTLIPS